MKHSNHRNQMADIKRTVYRESKAIGWTSKAAKINAEETINFMNGLQQLAFECGHTVTLQKE